MSWHLFLVFAVVAVIGFAMWLRTADDRRRTGDTHGGDSSSGGSWSGDSGCSFGGDSGGSCGGDGGGGGGE